MLTGGYQNTDVEKIDRMFNINLKPAFILSKLCMPHLLKTKGEHSTFPNFFTMVHHSSILHV